MTKFSIRLLMRACSPATVACRCFLPMPQATIIRRLPPRAKRRTTRARHRQGPEIPRWLSPRLQDGHTDKHDYAAAIDQLQALGHDDRASVANLIGYSYRKLGDYKLSQIWYERAR